MRPVFVPLLTALAAGAVAWHFGLYPQAPPKDSVLALAGAAASVGATLLGFMLAALAVLASINHLHLVQMMRRTGHYNNLLATLFAGCVVMLACTVMGFALLMGVEANPPLMCALVAVHLAALASLVDTGRKFWLVLSHLKSD